MEKEVEGYVEKRVGGGQSRYNLRCGEMDEEECVEKIRWRNVDKRGGSDVWRKKGMVGR